MCHERHVGPRAQASRSVNRGTWDREDVGETLVLSDRNTCSPVYVRLQDQGSRWSEFTAAREKHVKRKRYVGQTEKSSPFSAITPEINDC